MILEFAKCAVSLAAIFLSGGTLYLMFTARGDRRWLEVVSYGWGAGIVVLYVIGGVLIRIPSLYFRWHLYYLSLVIALTAASILHRVQRHGLSSLFISRDSPSASRPDGWAAAMLAFLAFHALLLFWINLTRPVFDSDAIAPQRWVGLAKTVYRLGGLPPSTQAWNPTFPLLIPLWPNTLTARWFDSLAAIPWFLFYILTLLITIQFIRRVTGSLKAGLAYACALASIPLMWIHVIRPGFSDLIVCYFMATVMSLLFLSYHYQLRRYFLFSLVFMIGACMSKQEAFAWMILIYGSYSMIYWHVRYLKSVSRILLIEGTLLAVSFAVYLLTLGQMHRYVTGRFKYLPVLFQFRYDPSALQLFFERTFVWATFGVYWYFVCGILIFLLIRFRDGLVRLMSWQCLLIGVLICYYLCFTGNVRITISGTNASRLLLHWVPVGCVLYAVFVSRMLQSGSLLDAARADSRA